jgi:hypothetical protein
VLRPGGGAVRSPMDTMELPDRRTIDVEHFATTFTIQSRQQ